MVSFLFMRMINMAYYAKKILLKEDIYYEEK